MATLMKDWEFRKLLKEEGKGILQPPKMKKIGEIGSGMHKENTYKQIGGGYGTIETEIAYYSSNGTTYKRKYLNTMSGITMYVNSISDVQSAGKAIKHAASYTNDNVWNGYQIVLFRLLYLPVDVASRILPLVEEWYANNKIKSLAITIKRNRK